MGSEPMFAGLTFKLWLPRSLSAKSSQPPLHRTSVISTSSFPTLEQHMNETGA